MESFTTDGNTYSPDDYATWTLGTVRVTSGRDTDALRQARRHPAGIAVQYREHGAWTPAGCDIAETFVPLPGSTLCRAFGTGCGGTGAR